MNQVIIVTGGAGYIGSHTVLELLESGSNVVVIDNFSNSSWEPLKRVQEITGKKLTAFHEVNILDQVSLEKVFATYAGRIKAVIHFAGLKAVGESVSIPLKYYSNNVTGTCVLLDVMIKYNVKNIVFSSSATVYGNVKIPEGGLTEEATTSRCTNPYGSTKLFAEQIISDVIRADPSWNAVILRYFNPVGAHCSGRIGEDPKGVPNNLAPYITQVAVGKLSVLSVYGNDYETKDGTGVRDFIHVVDLAKGHIFAVKYIEKNPGLSFINLGTGSGISVLDLVSGFKKASGKEIPCKFVGRRIGDIGVCYSNASKAWKEMGWKAELGVDRMCEDAWRWQFNNPDGYQ